MSKDKYFLKGIDGRPYACAQAMTAADDEHKKDYISPIQKTIGGMPADKYFAQVAEEVDARKAQRAMDLRPNPPSILKNG